MAVKERLPVLLDIAGLVLLSVAGFVVATWLGLVVAGVGFLLAGWRFQT